MELDSSKFRNVVIGLLDEQRTRTSRLASIPPALFGAMSVLTTILLWLDKYEKESGDMNTLKSDIKVKLVSLEDIPVRRRKSDLEDKLIEYVTQLEEAAKEAKKKGQPVPALKVEGGINYGHFATKISRLRAQKKIAANIFTAKRGSEFFLVTKS